MFPDKSTERLSVYNKTQEVPLKYMNLKDPNGTTDNESNIVQIGPLGKKNNGTLKMMLADGVGERLRE